MSSVGSSLDLLLNQLSDRCARVSTLRALLTYPHPYESLKSCRQVIEQAERALAVAKSEVEIEQSELRLACAYLEGLKAQSEEIDRLVEVVQSANLGIKNAAGTRRGGKVRPQAIRQ
jgi:hypothetical protein